MTRKTVTTTEIQALLAERGIEAPYQTVVRWVRSGRFPGAMLKETERGPVWRVPLKSVDSFTPPKRGRRPKQTEPSRRAA